MTKRYLAILAVAALLGPAACTVDDPGPEASPAPGRACPRELDAAFSAWAGAGFSGSIAVATGDRFDCLAAYGSADDATATPNTVETVFDIGSISKSFTAAAILHLADEGKLTLDDRAGALLPELRGPVREATVRHLLLHTSGLNGTHGNDSTPLSEEAALAAIGRLEVVARPGTRYLYSNAGYTLLALIVDKVSGSPYRDYVVSHILPLPDGRLAGGFWHGRPAAPGPRAVGHLDGGGTGARGDFAGPYWAVEGNGGLAMTTRDLASWIHALFTGAVLSPGSTEAIATPGQPIGGGRGETPGWVAYDESRYGQPFLAAAGGGGEVGHNAVVVWLPRERRTIAIAANKPKVSAEGLLEAIGPALARGEPLPTPSGPAGRSDLAAAAGEYTLDSGGSFQVTVRDGGLAVTAAGADAVAALFPPPAGVAAGDLRGHEERVRALLAGQTREGRAERAAVESAFGPLSGVAVVGTIAAGGELRTYVAVTAGGQEVLGWYAVNEAGGVEAAEVPAGEPPTLRLLPSGDDRYHPDDPTGAGPAVTVAFAGGRMTVTGPGGSATAERAG
ncbi:serine hydrolase domain-containing protein [Phytohabitans kaempferiae]|uniref:Serine hydrolase domain-containing protein n=1 Tax=Phytohabitans kaempferiae TaxID=1620943 RepID=A0ABV6MDK3_9ACTN